MSNLFVTSGATMSQAVIDFLFANVVQAKKITAGMIDATTFTGITFTGAIVQTAATGKRVVLSNNRMNFYGVDGSTAVTAGIIEGVPNGAGGGLVSIGSGTGGDVFAQFGNQALPTAGSCTFRAYGVAWFDDVYAGAGTMTARLFRAPATSDASMTSTFHAFQIGDDAGANLIMDDNELMVRNNGAPTSLYINGDGGNVGLGDSSSTVSIPGTINNPSIAAHMAAGTTSSSATVAAGGNTSVTVTLPSRALLIGPGDRLLGQQRPLQRHAARRQQDRFHDLADQPQLRVPEARTDLLASDGCGVINTWTKH
ncbi:hypothetical protein [Curtobacterium sp. 314Chir4.1]|uniref:hypothetical protein n=1 Tax=Curtobacterium sp. 314Chir4.1 TaxID=1279028 RepID=UPI001142B8A2|nr:hypothetical protein [Curtobacterium sp. 314Chir4.1]